MPVFSKLKRWLCCGIGGKEMETPCEPKVVKKHLRRGLVPPAAAFRKPRSISCPANLVFAPISVAHASLMRIEYRANGDNSCVYDADNLGEYCKNDNEKCIDESLVSSREDKIFTPKSFEKSESGEASLSEEEEEGGGQDSSTQTELEDDTCMTTNKVDAKDDKVPIVESERSCNTSKDQTLSLKEKIAAFSSLGFGRSAFYCTASQRRTAVITKKVVSENSEEDEDDKHIWGVTRRPRSSQRNREDSPWLEARRRTPASRFGRNLRPIYHALQQASRESRGKRHVKNADWLSAREVMKKANMKRKFRLTKKMRHCRLVLGIAKT